MNDIILLIAQAQTLFAEATDNTAVLIANVVMGGLLSILIAWLNHMNGSKLKAVGSCPEIT